MQLPPDYSVALCDPSTLRKPELDQAIEILQQGGAVDVDSARAEIPNATRLAILRYRAELVGLGTIKRERLDYAARVKRKSKHAFAPEMLELGYVAVCRGHSGLRLSGHIVNTLLASYDGDLFATTDHNLMKATLEHRGFARAGQEWQGSRGILSLWLRAGAVVRTELAAGLFRMP